MTINNISLKPNSFSNTNLQTQVQSKRSNLRPNLTKNQVAILYDGFIPHCRVKFYSLLNATGKAKYVVFHGAPPSLTGHPEIKHTFDFPNVTVRNYEISLCGKTIVYQPVLKHIIFGSFDAVVLGHELKVVSNLILFCWCKITAKPIVWWGHGFQKDKIAGSLNRFISKAVVMFKKHLARWTNMFIVYTEGGAAKLIDSGVQAEHIRVVRNTLDMDEQRRLHAEMINRDPRQIRENRKLQRDSKVLLYIGRIYKEKKIEELLALVERLNADKLCRSFVEAVIIGGGPELTKMQKAGAKIPGVHFTGELYEQSVVAEYLRLASAVVIPGKVGLAVNHAFSQGVPVITRGHNYHAPEVEYIINGQNGLIVQGDFQAFVRGTAIFLNSDEDGKRMAANALKTRDRLTLEFMVEAFDKAVMQVMS